MLADLKRFIAPAKQTFSMEGSSTDPLANGLSGVTTLNGILDNQARKLYQPVVDELFTLVPAMMARKIPEANVQQGFVFDTVMKFLPKYRQPKVLCVGCHEDTAWAGLKQRGLVIEAIDPAVNEDLDSFFQRWSTKKNSYQIIFSTSVIEHVENDELFVRQMADLLALGGVVVLTCDYHPNYKPGDKIPGEDKRFYTENDLRQRLVSHMPGCRLVGTPKWNEGKIDFAYAGCDYGFATFVVEKFQDRKSI